MGFNSGFKGLNCSWIHSCISNADIRRLLGSKEHVNVFWRSAILVVVDLCSTHSFHLLHSLHSLLSLSIHFTTIDSLQKTSERATYPLRSWRQTGIRTHDLSRRTAAVLRLRQRGHWDRQIIPITMIKSMKVDGQACSMNVSVRKSILGLWCGIL